MPSKGHVISPTLDFFLLGGASLILFPLIMVLWPVEALVKLKIIGYIIAASLTLDYFTNFPHFAYSYQLLYNNFLKKISGQIDPTLKERYIFAGIIIPLLMIIFFIAGYMQNSTALLKHSVNIMLLTAGWHYAKQGFGILIVVSAYNKVFYTPFERKLLLINSHLLWVYAWIMFNTGSQVKSYFGITFYTLGLAPVIEKTMTCLVILSTTLLIITLFKKYKRESVLPPFNGITAYVATAYLWIILRFGLGFDNYIHPVVLFIPAMHSIQYMTIVLKMKKNQLDDKIISGRAFAIFVISGIVIGTLLFINIPEFLDKTVVYDKAVFGTALFMFMFWIFINIHHYFIDNVIWRREGSEVKNYLFSAR